MHVHVRVKLLSDSVYLLHIAQEYALMSLYKILSVSFEQWINNGETKVTHEYNSVGRVVTQIVQLGIKGIPCNLSSMSVIEYILSSFAFMNTDNTTIDDNDLNLGNTI